MEWMTWEEIGVLAVNEFGGFIMCMISSFVFVYFLLRILSPKIEISPYINKKEVDGQSEFLFKIINKSMFPAYNVRFILMKRVPYIIDGNKVNHKMEQIELKRSELFSIASFKRGDYGDYAVQIKTDVDISVDIATNNLDFQLSVSAMHGLSNITKVVTKRYAKLQDIKGGSFKFGKSLDMTN